MAFLGLSFNQVTVIMVLLFLGIILGIGFFAFKKRVSTPDDFYLAGRGLGTVVLLMTMGATYFSMWTILGAYGSYYRNGIWFMCFTSWTVIHAVMVWLFGVRIWILGKRFNFITPGEMMEHYYESPMLRVLFAVIGVIGLVPYMLIQITGGSFALQSFTGGGVSYFWGLVIMCLVVGFYVAFAGFRGTAWTDTAMGIFFGSVMLFVTVYIIAKFGGLSAFKEVEKVAPDLLTNKGNWKGALGLAMGLLLSYWTMPHMWQKYYAAKSAKIIGRAATLTPLWNSWLMAVPPLVIGIMAHLPGMLPEVSVANSDNIVPLFFKHYAPLTGTIVIAAALSFGISTVNSQLLTSASIITEDLYVRFLEPGADPRRKTILGTSVVIILTVLLFFLALTPSGRSFLVPVASLGFAISIQFVPAALGPLFWPVGTKTGAVASLCAGFAVVIITKIWPQSWALDPDE